MDFDPGYGQQPWSDLCTTYPGADVYPQDAFRSEWGAVFHRGRLDGSAQVLVIGLAPGMQEVVTRRALIGHAGMRLQGFLAKIGIVRSYVVINAFLYALHGETGCAQHEADPRLVDYRNRWFDAICASGRIRAVIALGARAAEAWRLRPTLPGAEPRVVTMPHPTMPESSSRGNPDRRDINMGRMLEQWNAALAGLSGAIPNPDQPPAPVPYGRTFTAGEILPIPPGDLPPGLPAWMACRDHWSKRIGDNSLHRRGNLTLTIPREFLPPTAD